ncbi:MAG: hypothetical protein U0R69_01090 [Gaiellales bacterium]
MVWNGTADALVIDESGDVRAGIIPDVDATLPAGIEGKERRRVGAFAPVGPQLGDVESVSVLGNAAADKITIGNDSTAGPSLDSEGTIADGNGGIAVSGLINLNDDEDADVRGVTDRIPGGFGGRSRW